MADAHGNILKTYFADSDSEAEFEGFDSSDITRTSEKDYPTCGLINLDDNEDILRDINPGWSRQQNGIGAPGLKVQSDNNTSPMDYFKLFTTDSDFIHLATETNRYYDQSR